MIGINNALKAAEPGYKDIQNIHYLFLNMQKAISMMFPKRASHHFIRPFHVPRLNNSVEKVLERNILRKIHDEFRKKTVQEIEGEQFQLTSSMFSPDQVHLLFGPMENFWRFYIDKLL